MRATTTCFLALATALLGGGAAAQTPLTPADGSTGWWFYGPTGYSAQRVTAAGPGFTHAVRITCGADRPNVWDSAVGWNSTAAVNQGDLLQASFWVRKRSPLDGAGLRGQFDAQRDGSPWTASHSGAFPADSTTWRRYSYAFRSAETYATGGITFQFKVGRGPQQFDVGGFRVVNHGPNANPATLDLDYYYPGMDPDAPWRAEAAARIEAYRKGDLRVRVEDVDGRPVVGARVELDMTSPAFRWGSAVVGSRLAGTSTTDRTYQQIVRDLFTTTVLENDMKWPFIETWAAQSSRQGVAWLQANGLPVRGHNLIWPSWRNMPSDTQGLSAAALRTRIDNHFDAILTEFRGDFYDWDVLNEPFDNFDAMGRISGVPGVGASSGVLGNAEAVRWFQRARALDPAARLYLNDYNLIENDDPLHRAYTNAFVRYLLANGAPVDGLGFQGHFGQRLPGIETLRQNLQVFADLPLEFAVTEYDLPTLDEGLQADFLRDFMTLVFSEPKFTQFLKWGFWENAHWEPTAAMFRRDFSEKPAVGVWRDHVFNRWWTDLDAPTAGDGAAAFRGFRGAHRVRAAGYGQTAEAATLVGATAGEVVLRLPARVPRLVGRIQRAGWAGGSLAGVVANVDLRDPATGTPIRTLPATLASDGSYRLFLPADVAPRTVDVSVKWGPCLRTTVRGVNLPASGQLSLDLPQIPGDVDGDNAVTVFDYDGLSSAFDTSEGDANWDARADLDGDGSVTVFDYDLLSANFDRVGDD